MDRITTRYSHRRLAKQQLRRCNMQAERKIGSDNGWLQLLRRQTSKEQIRMFPYSAPLPTAWDSPWLYCMPSAHASIWTIRGLGHNTPAMSMLLRCDRALRHIGRGWRLSVRGRTRIRSLIGLHLGRSRQVCVNLLTVHMAKDIRRTARSNQAEATRKMQASATSRFHQDRRRRQDGAAMITKWMR